MYHVVGECLRVYLADGSKVKGERFVKECEKSMFLQ